jgi:hypothetical protein
MPMMFEQQPRESAKAFAAFSVYLGMGAERSLAAVGQQLGKSVGLIERWSAKFDWLARVAAHAAHLAIVERGAIEATARDKAAEWEKRESQLRETEWAMHEAAIAAAKRGLDAYMAREKVYANLADIARMLEIASKLGRLATGLGTDGERRTGDDLPALRVEVTVALEKICRSRQKTGGGGSNDALGKIFSGRSTSWLSEVANGRFCAGRRGPPSAATGRVRCGAIVRCPGRADGDWLRRCARLLETLPALQRDPNRPEDVLKVDADEDGVGGDDAADALRYLVATKARTVTVRKLRGL